MSDWHLDETTGLAEAIKRLERELPGWWWRVGNCNVSADATIAPLGSGPDSYLIEHGNKFDIGFDVDLRHPATPAQALNEAIDQAIEAKGWFI